MSLKYIRINSQEDIDIKKINLTNIKDRYIDNDGNRYATRFNIRTHKIEIVQILLGKEEVQKYKTQKNNFSPENDLVEDLSQNSNDSEQIINFTIPRSIQILDIQPLDNVNIEEIIRYFPDMVYILKERLQGILNNLKNSQVLNNKKADNGQDLFLEIMSFFDRQVVKHLDSSKDKLVELLKYPRPPTSYLSVLSHRQKNILETWSEAKVMDLIKAIIVGEDFLQGSEHSLQLLKEVKEIITPKLIDSIPTENQQRLKDARATCEFLEEQIYKDIQKILGWWKATDAIK